MLVWARGAQLPDRCVFCNEPANGYRLPKTFYWHEQIIYLALLGGLLLYFIVAVIVRKSATISYGLCEEHKKRRRVGIGLILVGLLSGFLTICFAINLQETSLGFVGLILMALVPIVGLLLLRAIAPARIDDQFA